MDNKNILNINKDKAEQLLMFKDGKSITLKKLGDTEYLVTASDFDNFPENLRESVDFNNYINSTISLDDEHFLKHK